jgi:hypothetical protein
MTPCLCPQCCVLPAPTYTEEFRRECLARHLLSKQADSRRQFYADFAKQHGEPAARQLIADVKREHNRAAR